MTNSKRIIEISLPNIRIANFFKLPLLAAYLAVGLIGGMLYWWKEVRPYFKPEKAVLFAPTFQVFASEDGKLESYSFEEGALFHKGESLFSIGHGLLSSQLAQIESEIRSCITRRQNEKVRLEQTMELFMQTQGEVSLGVSDPSALEAVLNEVQQTQQAESDLEQELSFLNSEKTALSLKIEDHAMRAPFEGVILKKYKEMGEVTKVGEPIFLICNAKDRWIETAVPEGLLGSLRIGSLAKISFPSFPGKQWQGTLAWVSPTVDHGLIKVRVKAENLPLQPGLSSFKIFLKDGGVATPSGTLKQSP
jgi:multidrug resistance efflux pump